MDTKVVKRIGTATAILAFAVVAVLVWLVVNSSSCSRTFSRWEAEYGRGVERVVTLYSATGEEIGRWEGVIDVEYVEERVDMVFFDERGVVNGRVVVSPGSGSLVVTQV